MEEPAAGLDIDNLSTSTPTAANKHIPYEGEEKEYVVKFLFRPKINKNTEVAMRHYALLQAISQIYPEVTIFNNYGATMKSFAKVMNYNKYLRNFKLQFLKGNDSKQRPSIYIAHHRLRSKIPISEIRRHATISKLLNEVNTRLSVHPWSEDDIRISNLGFFVVLDPGNVLEEELLETVRCEIHNARHKPIRKIPKFKCCFISPFVIDSSGNRCATKSYSIQCRQEDAKELVKLLKETYKTNPKFIFHKLWHDNPQLYYRAILKQNAYLADSRIVPIKGVSREMIFYLEKDIHQIHGVITLSCHQHSDTTGRWNIHTTKAHFHTVTKYLEAHLAQWAEH